MTIKNTATSYGLVAKTFHWVIAVLIIGLLPVGLFMTGLPASPQKFEIYALHKSFGLTVFFLGLMRIVWRFVSPPPPSLPNHRTWERTLAHAAHFWLYVCVIGMPLSGWLMSSAGEFPIPFFGLRMPALMGKDEGLAELFEQVHGILAYTLLAVLALHIAGALKHHVLDRDETLNRMAFLKGRYAMPVLVVIVAGLSYAACAALLLKDEAAPAKQAVQAAQGAATEAATPEGGWTIDRAKSTLSFETMLYGSPLHGDFKNFSGTILFDPDNLAAAKADIRIAVSSAETGDASRDQTMQEEAWFDAAAHPEAHFTATDFTKTGDNKYTAKGTLTIRDKSLPVTLPFTFDQTGNTAHVTGGMTLDRGDFGIGQGEWEKDDTVGRQVKVLIDLTATR